MRLSNYIVSGLQFSTICALLCFLVPRRTTAYRQRNSAEYQDSTALDFAADRSSLEAHMRQHTRSYCTCGEALLQSKFCKHDFVVVAKRKSPRTQRFNGIHGSGPWHFAGTVITLSVEHVVKGSLEVNKNADFHFIQGSTCGVTPHMIPRENSTFLITGFHLRFPGCDKVHQDNCLQTKELFLVTRCSASQPLESLSITQVAGLFLDLYSCSAGSCSELRPYFWEPLPQSPTPFTCSYSYTALRCYTRFALCTKSSLTPNTCTFRAVNRIPTSQSVLAKLPPVLHPTIHGALASQVTDEHRFRACLRHSGLA
ncbi:unnamed protein product [Mesocestoides corti]|uniref:SWIM-type domain-containing protein n=1 Tax=Mesocestoides corti TaxID=53468 RepID=A0A158QSM0_MESCO|nr:unnamed protein product [Mesocestoides corti]